MRISDWSSDVCSSDLVVDTGSISKAAAQANVTQPTLSVGIGKLERLIGATLFHRTSRRVHLTEAGSRLLPHARRIEEDFNIAVRNAVGGTATSVVRLGALSTIPTPTLERLVAAPPRRDAPTPLELREG